LERCVLVLANDVRTPVRRIRVEQANQRLRAANVPGKNHAPILAATNLLTACAGWFMVTVVVRSGSVATTLPLSGERVSMTARLSLLSRRDARALIERLGGEVLEGDDDSATLVLGPSGTLQASDARGTRVMSEDELCELSGLPPSDALRTQFKTARDIRAMYPAIRDEHLRFFEKWGLVRPVAGRFYGFSDLHLIKQAATELEKGTPLNAVVRALASERQGQLQL